MIAGDAREAIVINAVEAVPENNRVGDGVRDILIILIALIHKHATSHTGRVMLCCVIHS